MRKIREMLRLRLNLGRGIREIARGVGASHSTVSDVLRRVEAAGLSWPLPSDMDDLKLEQELYPVLRHGSSKPEADWSWVHRELRKKGVTLHLLWLEYRAGHPDGYVYSRFCQLYRRWEGKIDPVLRQEYRAGEKVFVDFAGQTVPITDPLTREVWQAPVYVAALGASSYTYAEALMGQDVVSWVGAHVRMLEFYGGVPEVLVPDQLKSGVSGSCRYEPEINPTFADMAGHYDIYVIPARPRKPRDKAKVEAAVGEVSRQVLAPLRNRTFYSLREANRAIWERLALLNERKFQKLDESRRSLFEKVDRPALRPLPGESYAIALWKKARVNIDYHVQLQDVYYSVPFQLVKAEVDVRFTERLVEILHKGRRVASHARSRRKGAYVTNPEHRPTSHQKHLEWTPSRMIRWGATVGPSTAELVKLILESRPHPEQGYRSCLGIMSLARKYSAERLELAARRAIACGATSYRSVGSILASGLDGMPLGKPEEPAPVADHENLRGASYYAEKGATP